ncbi:DNA polymerase III subunit alpha [Thiocystis violascens]|uniref:DNA polymerase III subunit alpha n=1 Tax=Thiocystis violascens (strain ATCC 17096 / DSM 198 / 6111) TaxID=765911 RepID=I3Y7X7_THIV6|nr:DNA polymerase III subunit alpha [Thiocystis violascens]AFL73095.1 DNA-directed DNA polymerase III PolC [Thiocystis violascens DSM 198]
MDPRFVHLHLHSEYSLVDGLVRIKPLVKAVAAAGMPAVAVTDQVNLFSLVRFYKAAVGAGLKPIAGADLWVRNPEDANKPHRLVLLVQDDRGYGNLTRLISRGYVEGQHLGLPQVEPDWIESAADGLIALSGGPQGDVARALLNGRPEVAERQLDRWLTAFGDRYYLELVRTGRESEAELIELSVDLALRRGVPVVATNDVRFLAASDFEAHEARVCIHEGRTLDDPRRPRLYSDEQYLRTPGEMAELFADLPEALENSVEIAKRCNLELTLGKNYLPAFPVPAGMTIDAFFAEQSRQGLDWRLERILDRAAPDFAEQRRAYDERLALELDVIVQMGFPGYFLIVADFIQWAKDNGIPVGPGRGSGAGSLVAYALKITDLDPIEHDLLFERFLNPERVSMPDFDVDFCMEGRDRVIDYVADKYGREAVSQIITFGTMAAKAVVRDVGRVMGHPYGFVDRVAKMVPFELGMTLGKALAESDDLKLAYQDDEEVRALIDMARKLEGLARNAGKHAGGVVIAPTKLTDFAPLYCEPGGVNLVTQFDKDDVEQVGLVKFDFLGLRTLTIIDWALKTINPIRLSQGEPPVEIDRIDAHDERAFNLLKQCQTTAVFQLESRGMKELIKKLQPDSFGDITALVALFRPGPLQSGMVDDFINRKHGRADVAYPHPDLEPVLKPTYGIILYQEQVMQIAQVLAGYSLGGADLLRRAMGKKKASEMDKQRAIFEQGSVARGIDASVATYIFDLMDKFAGYGFNKTVHRLTKIRTLTGDQHIEDCRAGDVVFSMNPDGSLVQSTVVVLHDHGQVPLWLVEFDDGTSEQCTLDHKWLTDDGQVPLWKILQTNERVWGTDPAVREQGQGELAGHLVFRQPVRATFVGWHQGYDLEVDHPEHNFLLASGLCCSNSHSAAYALVSYQTLWLKAHYPAAFMAAVLSADMDNTDKVVTLIDECRAMKLRVEPPTINRSAYRFTIGDAGTVIYGMGAIKGVGEAAIESILEVRAAGGDFRDLWDFCRRIDLHKVNRRVLEALIRAGALDGLGPNRATLMAQLPLALKTAEQHNATQAAGQTDLFGALEPTAAPPLDPQLASEIHADWEDEQRLQGEKETLGLYLTGHPIDRYEAELKAMGGARIARLLETDRELGRRDRRDREKRTVVGLVVSVRHGKTQRGRMGSVLLDDRTGRIEATVFSELYDQFRNLLVPDQLLSIAGSLNFDEFRDAWTLRADAVRTFEQARESAADHLALILDLSDPADYAQGAARIESLREALAAFRDGDLPVRLRYRRPGAVGDLMLGNAWRVQPTDALLKRLRQLLGSDAVKVSYERVLLSAPMPETQTRRLASV